MPTDQSRFVAATFGLTVIRAVALQGPLRQMLAVFAIGELTREVVVLQHRSLLAVEAAFELQTRFAEVVVPASDRCGPGFQAHVEPLDCRRFCRHPTAWQVQRRFGQPWENRLVITEHQQVPIWAVLEVVVNADLGTQTLNECQVAFGVLHAVLALGVVAAEPELEGIALDAMVFEDLRDDRRHAFMLENPLIDTLTEIRQARHETDLIARQTLAGIALAYAINLTVNTGTVRIETQKCLTVQQTFEFQVRALADQFQVKAIGLADGFLARELKYLELILDAVEGQRETRLIGRREHPMCLCRMKAGDSA